MAHILKKIGDTPNVPFYSFECDNSSDLVNIPLTMVPMGSRCYVINEGKTYALNSHQEWKLVPSNSGSSDPSGPDEPSEPGEDIIYDGGEEV